MREKLYPRVIEVCEAIAAAGGRAMLVGGCVRDMLLGVKPKDYDVEVYGVAPERLYELLAAFGRVNTVGEQYAVYKVVPDDEGERHEIDVSLPRRESKTAPGHRGFYIEGDPTMSFADAARRRDFTINAILYDPLTGEIIDPYGGQADLEARLLRAVSPETFVEDSLRVLRAMQFAARFEMTIEPETLALCRGIDLSDLPRERVWGEFEKLLTLAERPSIGLEAALDLRIIEQLLPELQTTVGCRQEYEWHPEGDVFVHTGLVLDEGVPLTAGLPVEKRITVMLSLLCHDLGKPLTTEIIDGRVRSLGHDEAGVEPAQSVLDRFGVFTINGYDVRAQVPALVREHLRPGMFFHDRKRLTPSAFRRLSGRVDMDLLYRVAKADSLGRGPAADGTAADWFIAKARELGVEAGPPDPLLQGRDLIELGYEPGPRFGEVLRAIYDRQIEGEIETPEQALDAAKELFER